MNRLLPALVAFVLTVAALVPSALTLPQHGDERLNLWKAAYYGERLAHLDFSPFVFVVLRLGWLGLLVPLVLLGTSFVRIDLAAAWAEDPFLFGVEV